MWFRLPLVTLVALSFLTVPGIGSGAGLGPDTHDCLKIRKGRYKCVRGPLAGRTFKSQKAMITALTKGSHHIIGAKKAKVVKKKRVFKKKKRVKKKVKARKARKRSSRR